MRPQSAVAWRSALANYSKVHLHTADPGADAIAAELAPLLREMGNMGHWFAEGWSARRRMDAVAPETMAARLSKDEIVLVGSHIDFARTQAVFAEARRAGAKSGFIFDHWKNYREHFAGGILPDLIVVPDALGRNLLAQHMGFLPGVNVLTLPHPGLEASADRILGWALRSPGTVVLLLDPTEPKDGLGYDWRDVIRVALADLAPGARLVVRPHPRQDVEAVGAAVRVLTPSDVDCSVSVGDTEQLMAEADQVWGSTTVALMAALLAGKTIRSYQPRRSQAGAEASNPYLEQHLAGQTRA